MYDRSFVSAQLIFFSVILLFSWRKLRWLVPIPLMFIWACTDIGELELLCMKSHQRHIVTISIFHVITTETWSLRTSLWMRRDTSNSPTLVWQPITCGLERPSRKTGKPGHLHSSLPTVWLVSNLKNDKLLLCSKLLEIVKSRFSDDRTLNMIFLSTRTRANEHPNTRAYEHTNTWERERASTQDEFRASLCDRSLRKMRLSFFSSWIGDGQQFYVCLCFPF